ncbi:phosphohydrolase [Anaeromicrobium sediminis]|uniref:Phosphohydrolase n=1 Tax=Anaeromicrobium sediminis TaxID=1478221 RepID=A0A267MPB5_9FIRM|nr:phosphohydrolase [Anaeromicrobium sediminis]PAB61287.1 phosphohydrolase [Anaeromicrobium sediminis]
MKCFYHNDEDGKCSGFWVAFNARINDTDLYDDIPQFIEIDYRIPFPMKTIRPNEQIYIVDFSISPDEMRELLKITKNVTWIDHHKTAIEKYEDFEYQIRGVRYDGVAGCMLAYCYINHMTAKGEGEIKPFELSMTNDAPRFTKLIADWDVWKFDYGDDTRFFQAAFNSLDFNPRSEEWLNFIHEDGYENKLIEEGKIIIRYRDCWGKNYMNLGFETEFEGHNCFAVNLGYCNSEYFKSLSEEKYDMLITFVFDGKIFKVIMYSETVDVSEIAKKYDGGGHKGASGFQVKELPFSIK